MFEPTLGFPNNVVLALKEQIGTLQGDVPIFTRPIRRGDPAQAIAITASMWTPDDESFEFIGAQGGQVGPTVGRYLIGIQTFNQDMDEERGLATQSSMATAVRVKLSRDIDVRVALAVLTHTEYGMTERFTRSEFQAQRFLSNEIDGAFYYLSNTEFLVETETH